MCQFNELNEQELDLCNGGGVVLGCLAIAGCFLGGVAVGAGATIGVVSFCKWLKL